ncbi:MAG: glycine--tRNA ligase subunit beta [Tissierellia bacterium]|nr:glycine--tRNA ligase subunit beta [Tissierellia bacterium]
MHNFVLEIITEPMDYGSHCISPWEIMTTFGNVMEKYSIDVKDTEVCLTFRRISIQSFISAMSDDDITTLKEAMPIFLKSIEVKDTMRWGKGDIAFPRPITHLMCLYDDKVVDFTVQGITGNRHATIDYIKTIEITSAETYEEQMKPYLIFSEEERLTTLRSMIKKNASAMGKEAHIREDHLKKLAFICERPTILSSEFDRSLLALPDDVLIRILQELDNVEPLYKDGSLSDIFLVINPTGNMDREGVIKRYGATISSELANIQGLFKEDSKMKLEEYVPRLNWISENEKIGSLYDKTNRMEKLLARIGEEMSLAKEMWQTIEKASHLVKADIATWTVKRYPGLRGQIAYELLMAEKGDPLVAKALKEQYLPDESGQMPSTMAGAILGIADRFDDLIGYAVVGEMNRDSGYIRDWADSSILLMEKFGTPISIGDMVDLCLYIYTEDAVCAFDYKNVYHEVTDFLKRRIKMYLRSKDVHTVLLDDGFIEDRKIVPTMIQTLETISEGLEESDISFIKVYRDLSKIIIKASPVEGELDSLEAELLEGFQRSVLDFGEDVLGLTKSFSRHQKIMTELIQYYEDHPITHKSLEMIQQMKEQWI